jgi:hypothetical protein
MSLRSMAAPEDEVEALAPTLPLPGRPPAALPPLPPLPDLEGEEAPLALCFIPGAEFCVAVDASSAVVLLLLLLAMLGRNGWSGRTRERRKSSVDCRLGRPPEEEKARQH